MSRYQPPAIAKKSSTPWDRLRPVKQDPLEAMGLVSKGDNRLLDIKTQESFYHKIVARYMQFCTTHNKDIDEAFASLTLNDNLSALFDPAKNPPVRPQHDSRPIHLSTGSTQSKGLPTSKWATEPSTLSITATAASLHTTSATPADELSTILTALRKLREGILATSSTTSSPVFSQRVHVFNIRVAILALHPPSYHPSLSYLLTVLNTKSHPLPISELNEMTTYMILDLGLRQNDLVAAYTLRHRSAKSFGYESRSVDSILRAVVTNNWVAFWQIRREVDGYVRAMMHWHIDTIRKTTLKVFGRAYMKVDLKWLLKSASGNEMTWEELVEKEAVGWSRVDNMIEIRKPKTRA